jgi:flagellin
MALTVTTNLSSLIVQNNLNDATSALNTAIERMTTGYKINHARDNAAGYSIAEAWKTKLGSIDVASENATMGLDLLQTAEDNYSLIMGHLQRMRDLTEQAANGTYGTDSLAAIKAEFTARVEEINRIAYSTEYNDIKLMNGNGAINLQVGIKDTNSVIALSEDLFKKADITTLTSSAVTGLTDAKYAQTRANLIDYSTTTAKAADQLTVIDKIISNISTRITNIGAAQNKIESAVDALTTQSRNITSSLSTLRDTDVAQESSAYIQAQILQQASATLLSTANQAPSIALNLI